MLGFKDWEDFVAGKKEAVQTTLYDLCKQDTAAIVGNKYKLNVTVTNVDDPINWWFHSCKSCWRKMIQCGASSKFPACRTPDERYRYRLKVSAIDVEANAEDLPVTGRLTFFGNCADVITGKEADLLAPLTKGRPNYIPPAITATVGKNCTITAEVDQETYDANPGVVVLTVSKA
ncbi:hypothetical protein QYE76_068664 [Lolium multiflorum]|uniref:Uncharacterized protein n=1 Tax=Lolium multiflorum TaxID=4521 RepID=A0AAD8SFR4_LOLMU|nr:hypothetical protein QYE76_068664 [Lolium multiflorum]